MMNFWKNSPPISSKRGTTECICVLRGSTSISWAAEKVRLQAALDSSVEIRFFDMKLTA